MYLDGDIQYGKNGDGATGKCDALGVVVFKGCRCEVEQVIERGNVVG